MSLSMVFGHGFVSTTQQTSTFVIFRAISALRECLRGRAMSVTNPDQVCCQKTISEFLFVNIISVELYQVHLIPYHQSPLTMLLRESLSVERMRQTKVVDEELKECQGMSNKTIHLFRSCWWEVSLPVWRTSTTPWRHWGRLADLFPKD